MKKGLNQNDKRMIKLGKLFLFVKKMIQILYTIVSMRNTILERMNDWFPQNFKGS